jgi:hypothetical protein
MAAGLLALCRAVQKQVKSAEECNSLRKVQEWIKKSKQVGAVLLTLSVLGRPCCSPCRNKLYGLLWSVCKTATLLQSEKFIK